jgi:methylphosphotriester-DNA--protein-cysteine methyltransferase
LVRAELVAQDRSIGPGLENDVVSLRSMQRRVRRATGMTHAVIRQIARAHEAVDALGQGMRPSDVAAALGYADQPHLTRSLRRFIGQTPAQALNTGRHWSASSRLLSGGPTRS